MDSICHLFDTLIRLVDSWFWLGCPFSLIYPLLFQPTFYILWYFTQHGQRQTILFVIWNYESLVTKELTLSIAMLSFIYLCIYFIVSKARRLILHLGSLYVFSLNWDFWICKRCFTRIININNLVPDNLVYYIQMLSTACVCAFSDHVLITRIIIKKYEIYFNISQPLTFNLSSFLRDVNFSVCWSVSDIKWAGNVMAHSVIKREALT